MADPPRSNDDTTGDEATSNEATSDTDATTNHTETHPDPALVALFDDEPGRREYTIFPAKSDAIDLVTTWITIDEQSLHDLENWR